MNLIEHLTIRQRAPDEFADRLSSAAVREPLVIALGQLDALAAIYGNDVPANIAAETSELELALAMGQQPRQTDCRE